MNTLSSIHTNGKVQLGTLPQEQQPPVFQVTGPVTDYGRGSSTVVFTDGLVVSDEPHKHIFAAAETLSSWPQPEEQAAA